jgi:hypothetical protein
MSDLFDQVTSDQDPITKLMSKIPGFKGYIERSTRRKADKLLREQIATQFSQLKTRVGEIQQDFASAGELQYLDDLETAATKLQTFIDKVSHAAYGYAGFFDAVKIKEEELAKIYEFDLAMIELGEEIERAIDNINASIDTDGLPASIRHLISLTRDLVSSYDRRDEVVTSVS